MNSIPIIVIKGMGRPANPNHLFAEIDEENIHEAVSNLAYAEFEATVKSHPCPSLANTEPGKTVMAELRWQVAGGFDEWFECTEGQAVIYNKRGDRTRQIWVPIVEQKDGEGIPNSTKLLEMCKSAFDGYVAEEKRNGNTVDESFYGVFQTGYMAGYFERSLHHQ